MLLHCTHAFLCIELTQWSSPHRVRSRSHARPLTSGEIAPDILHISYWAVAEPELSAISRVGGEMFALYLH